MSRKLKFNARGAAFVGRLYHSPLKLRRIRNGISIAAPLSRSSWIAVGFFSLGPVLLFSRRFMMDFPADVQTGMLMLTAVLMLGLAVTLRVILHRPRVIVNHSAVILRKGKKTYLKLPKSQITGIQTQMYEYESDGDTRQMSYILQVTLKDAETLNLCITDNETQHDVIKQTAEKWLGIQ